VVAYSVQGLGRLQDVAAIPLIEKAWERLPADARRTIEMELPWYSRPEAEQLAVRLVPDPKTRDYDRRDVQRMQLLELQRVASRTSGTVQK
jgi:hypothetical protein